MSSATPSPATVLEVVDTLAPSGTPLTTREVADEFDCTARTIYNKLEILADEGAVETKKVGARGRVWWRRREQSTVGPPDSAHSGVFSATDRLREYQQSFEISTDPAKRDHIYNVIFNRTFQFIGLLEPDGTLVEANDAALTFGGLTRDDVVGEPFWQAHWWQISDRTQSRLRGAIDRAAGGEFVRYEVEVQGADRTAIIDFSLRPVTNDEDEVILLVPEGRDITELKDRERRLQRVDRLNTVIRTIVRTVARAETRDEIAQTVCETLLEFDAYQATFVGEFSQSFDDFDSWAMAGDIETYLEEAVDDEAPPLSESLGANAVRTGELQARDELSDVPHADWTRLATDLGAQSYAAVPLDYQDTTYGVLGVCADRPDAFDREKRRILTELAEIIGYALYALERKEVLDPTIELEFQSARIAHPFRAETDAAFDLTLDSVVGLPNGTQQQFWTVDGLDPQIARTVFLNSFPVVLDVELLKKAGDTAHFQVTADEESTAAIFDTFGGQLQSATIRDDTATVIGHFPETIDTTAVTRALRERYPDIELAAQRRLLTSTYLRQLVEEHLTDRQRTVLRLAYFGGYYERPRLSTGDELAGELGISRQTFHHHLRKAEVTVFYHLFERATTPPSD